jgi:hypothetical protein
MPFSLERFQVLRPRLFHLTAKQNVARILQLGLLFPASELMRAAKQEHLVRERRKMSVEIALDGTVVHIRDQAPLHKGNTDLKDLEAFERFVEELNSRVFFWPGNESSPIPSGMRHFARYASEACSVLAIPTEHLFRANASRVPEFCRFNSGSPRCSRGNHAPRGLGTFLPAIGFPGTPSSVVEVTYRAPVKLPMDHVRVLPVSRFR